MRILTAAWVLPVTRPPIPAAGVAIDGGRIAGVGLAREVRERFPEAVVEDLGASILLPGLVNAHTHLSLTGLAGPLAGIREMTEWLGEVSRRAGALTAEEVREAVRQGIRESRERGTALVGEITTRPEGVEALVEEGLPARVYFEFLGIHEDRARERFAAAVAGAGRLEAPHLRAGLSPHAPYSVWPPLWAEAAATCRRRGWRWSAHVLEHPGERELTTRGTGPLRAFLERMGFWNPAFPLPGTGPVTLLDRSRALGPEALLVHGIHLTPDEMRRLAATRTPLCLCPRSNRRLGHPPPPVRELLEAGVPLCLGTDSKASNDDLGVWGEMRRLHQDLPALPPERLLHWATSGGAEALGFADRAGSLEPGTGARLLALPGTPRENQVHAALLDPGVEAALRRVGAWEA